MGRMAEFSRLPTNVTAMSGVGISLSCKVTPFVNTVLIRITRERERERER